MNVLVESLAIVHICNHVIDYTRNIPTANKVLRVQFDHSYVPFDVVCSDGEYLADIYNVYTEDERGITYYYENIDFTRYTNDKITWKTPSATVKNPTPGQTYIVDAINVKREIIKYSQEDCPRCNGNGWYVDLTNGNSMVKATGPDKIIQDFTKLMLTQKEDGKDLFSMVGKETNSSNGNVEDIVAFIKSCEEAYLSNQFQMSSTLGARETLSRVVISSVEYDRSDLAYYISITLLLASGENADINLKV